MDRTGHESSQMLQTYRKKERLHIGTGLGDYVPLDEAIPELLRTSTSCRKSVPGFTRPN